jgi:hypothetical protein
VSSHEVRRLDPSPEGTALPYQFPKREQLVADVPTPEVGEHPAARDRPRAVAVVARAADRGPAMSGRCDEILRALRESSPDAYRCLPEITDSWAWRARCPCAPDAGHTMAVIDRGDDAEPELLCRFGCDQAGIRRMLGRPAPAEEERLERGRIFAEELQRHRRWVAGRRAA